ncbi:MAG: hypothetical protein KDA96_25795, partial [Planctomycetaceae bacterium]|nr:hypothetical protein [Planctomycetaceae bacterium]
GIMVGGRGVRLSPASAVTRSPLFLCVDIDGAGSEANVRSASIVERAWLPRNLLEISDDLFFHPGQKQVVARRRTRFVDLILDENPVGIEGRENQAKASQILFDHARTDIARVLPVKDESFSQFVIRIACLAQWVPELALPCDRQQIHEQVLRQLCEGRRSFADLQQAPWTAVLHSLFEYPVLQKIEKEAPERIEVPSGNRIRLVYEAGRPPVLAVRIQEVFGLRETPRIALGRVPVLLHLLAPNMRPQQVTDDLASFWANTYETVRRELKRRYPKHAWPDDPLTAAPVRKG